MGSHKDLQVGQASRQLAVAVYELTARLPKEELYGVSGQMRRAVISIPANLAEGSARGHRKEFLQFVHVARGSLAELETYLDLLPDLRLCSAEQVDPVQKLAESVGRMLTRLAASLREEPKRNTAQTR